MLGPTGLCHGTLATSLTFGKWMEMLWLTQASVIIRNPQYVIAISIAAELPHNPILRAKMYLMMLQLPVGLRQA